MALHSHRIKIYKTIHNGSHFLWFYCKKCLLNYEKLKNPIWHFVQKKRPCTYSYVLSVWLLNFFFGMFKFGVLGPCFLHFLSFFGAVSELQKPVVVFRVEIHIQYVCKWCCYLVAPLLCLDCISSVFLRGMWYTYVTKAAYWLLRIGAFGIWGSMLQWWPAKWSRTCLAAPFNFEFDLIILCLSNNYSYARSLFLMVPPPVSSRCYILSLSITEPITGIISIVDIPIHSNSCSIV